MTLGPCVHEKELTRLLALGHYPHACRQRGRERIQPEGWVEGWPILVLEQTGDFVPGAEQQQANAGGCETGNFGDFAMGVAFGVSQP